MSPCGRTDEQTNKQTSENRATQSLDSVRLSFAINEDNFQLPWQLYTYPWSKVSHCHFRISDNCNSRHFQPRGWPANQNCDVKQFHILAMFYEYGDLCGFHGTESICQQTWGNLDV